eukprot:gene5826-16021_t
MAATGGLRAFLGAHNLGEFHDALVDAGCDSVGTLRA